MRILYLCHRIPYPPDKGEKIRAFHELRGLSAAHDVDLVTLVDDPQDLVHRAELQRYCRKLTVAQIKPKAARAKALPYLFTRTALTVPYFHSAELAREVDAALSRRSYDRVFVYSSAMMQYATGDAPPIVTDLVDVDSDKWVQYARFAPFPWSLIYRREGSALRRYESVVCRESAAVVVTTEREASLTRQICPAARVHVIPNGVDADYFRPAAEAKNGLQPTVSFMGDMSYFPNEEAAAYFAKSVFPMVRAAVPDARFLVVGRRPSRAVLQLKKLEGVEVTGQVPDVRPYLAQAHASVAPFSIAAGIPNKVLEAMASGLPVVATPRALQGLSPAVAQTAETADGAEPFAAKVIELLRSPQMARSKGLESRRQVMAEHNWERSLRMVLHLVEKPEQRELACAGAGLSDAC